MGRQNYTTRGQSGHPRLQLLLSIARGTEIKPRFAPCMTHYVKIGLTDGGRCDGRALELDPNLRKPSPLFPLQPFRYSDSAVPPDLSRRAISLGSPSPERATMGFKFKVNIDRRFGGHSKSVTDSFLNWLSFRSIQISGSSHRQTERQTFHGRSPIGQRMTLALTEGRCRADREGIST